MSKKPKHVSKERILNSNGTLDARAIQTSLDKLTDNSNIISSGILGKTNLVKNILVTTSNTVIIKHGLGRAYSGYIVVDADSPVVVHTNINNPRKLTELHIIANANATISVLIF